MNVVFLAHSFPRFAADPVGSFLLRLAVALREEGIRVHAVAPMAAGLAQHEELLGVPVTRFRYAPGQLQTLAYTGTMRTQVAESWPSRIALAGLISAQTWRAIRVATRVDARVLHAHWWFPNGLAAVAAGTVCGLPSVVTLHGSDVRIAAAGSSAGSAFRAVARRSAAITAVSSWLAESARTISGRDVDVAPMPVDESLFPAAAHPRPPRFLFVGKLNEQKGIQPFISALAMLGPGARAEVIAGVGSDSTPWLAEAERQGVGESIYWLPLQDQAGLAARYGHARALVAPAVDEGLGLVAIEAMLCATPVIAYASGGHLDSVIHGETGFLVPPGDVKALATAMQRLLDDPALAARMGKRARKVALERFGSTASARRYADIYRRVASVRTSANARAGHQL